MNSGCAPHEYDHRYLEYITLFNRRDFYDAHEVLEDLWLDDAGERHKFYQGLIHFAAAFQLLWRRNLAGFRLRLDSTKKYLAGYPDEYEGLNLAEVRRVIGYWQGTVADTEPGGMVDYDDSMIPHLKLN